MRDTKRRMEFFSFYDHTGIETHLERMAEWGWLLDKIGNFTWHYRRIEPKKLTFCVSYFPRASLFDPQPSQEQETFYDFCQHTGWKLAAASAQMQVFYNERPNPVPIDTDPAMEVEAIHQAAKKSWLISQIVLLAVGVLNFGQFLFHLLHDPITTLSSPLHLFALVSWPILILLIGTDFTTYFRWRHRALKAAEQGEFLATKSHPILQKTALAVVLAGLAWCLSYLRGGMLTVMVMTLVCTFGIVLLVVQLRELLKRWKVSKGANRVVTFGACVVLPIIMVVLVTDLVLSAGGRMGEDDREPPLGMSELLGTGPDDGMYGQSMTVTQSPLAAVTYVHQSYEPWGEGSKGYVWMSYTVTQVKAAALYNICKDHLLGENDTRGAGQLPVKYFTPIDPAPWDAAEAYRFVMDGEALDLYLLCYEGRIVKLDLDWPPAAEQMAAVGEKLGGQ